MNDGQRNNNGRKTHLPARVHSGRPPIEWPVRDATPSTDNQRAAALARQQISRTYQQPTTPQSTSTTTDNTENTTTPANPEPYDINTYHQAWQRYYHQYFYQYYAGWYQQQKQNEKSTPAAPTTPQAETTQKNIHEETVKELREKVKQRVLERSKKVQSSHHFKPMLVAAIVGVLFLSVNYNQVALGAIRQYIAPGSVVTTPIIVEPDTQAAVGPEPKIIIPKIGVEAPVVYDEPRVDEPSYQAALERGVVRLGNTPDPGMRGNIVIGGHSSNNVFNAGGYKYVFVNLKQLDLGDIFYLNFEGVRYTYKVTVAKKIVTPTDTSVLQQTSTPTVTLFTCDPPGTNINRLIVQAEQISPDPAGAQKSTAKQTPVNETNPLPSVAPSVWDRIFRR